MDIREMKLIGDWKYSWRLLSVQMAAALAVLDTAYEYLPVVQTYLPDGWVRWIALAIIAGRVISQSGDRDAAKS